MKIFKCEDFAMNKTVEGTCKGKNIPECYMCTREIAEPKKTTIERVHPDYKIIVKIGEPWEIIPLKKGSKYGKPYKS